MCVQCFHDIFVLVLWGQSTQRLIIFAAWCGLLAYTSMPSLTDTSSMIDPGTAKCWNVLCVWGEIERLRCPAPSVPYRFK